MSKNKKNIKKVEKFSEERESTLKQKEKKLEERKLALDQKEKELSQKETMVLKIIKNIRILFILIVIWGLAISIAFIFFLFRFNQLYLQQKSFLDNIESTISTDNNDSSSQYDDFVYSIFYVDSDSYLDVNNNIFYLDRDCTAGNEITNPIFASRKCFSIRNSNGDNISVYLLKDGRLVYIPSHKNVDIYLQN